MSVGYALSSLGLLLDIAGIVVIFVYGVPRAVEGGSRNYLALSGDHATDPVEESRIERFKRRAYIGLGLLIGGFSLQLLGNSIQIEWIGLFGPDRIRPILDAFFFPSKAWLPVVGLSLDVVGATVIAVDLFIAARAVPLTADMTHIQEPRSERLKKRWLGLTGLAFLLLGFGLQIVGQWPASP